MSVETPAQRHRRVADVFGARVALVDPSAWVAASPVPEWRARDVVDHLVHWPRELLSSSADVELDPVPPTSQNPAAAWAAHDAQMQALLDDPGERMLVNPHIGELPIDVAVDRFYTTDVLMHTWDLARATGQAHGLDADECTELLAGMEPIDEMLRASGQYGPRVAVADGADPVDALMAFIGRDPAWHPGVA